MIRLSCGDQVYNYKSECLLVTCAEPKLVLDRMANKAAILFLLVVVFAVVLSDNGVYAFGAGNIPS
jgi:hypothetical protein